LPGIPLALARPDVTVTLLDSALRRVSFLTEAVAALALGDRVAVLRGRVEELPRTQRYPVVTARAVAPFAQTLTWCRPRLRPGGRLLVLVGARDAASLEGRPGVRLHRCGANVLEAPVTVAEVFR
jgi:16S rRNA (guanine527-N7)-methyltransferase